jgi:hypothetical protein
MDEIVFQHIKAALDTDLDAVGDALVGIKLGWDVYREFRRRGLLIPKQVDMTPWKWMRPSYRDKIVWDGFDVPDGEYRIGKPNA